MKRNILRTFDDKTHFYGRIWGVIAAALIIAYPFVCMGIFGASINWGLFASGLSIIVMYCAVGAVETFTYTPMLGSGGTYLGFVTGNLSNLKVPCALNCMEQAGVEKGTELIVQLLNEVMKPDQSTVVLLETMAGKGTEIGGRFEELAAIIDGVELKDKIGVCLDTCHVSDAGYDIAGDPDGVLRQFDEIIGLERLHALHINDSMNPVGAHKDRHARIGEGCIGYEALQRFVNHPLLKGLPCILETPNELDGYAKEISLLRAGYR